MSTVSTIPTHADAHDGHGDGNGHDPHLAHHFDTPEQQFASNKLGMWVFLATEILMFGGLFCAYSVYRHNHPEVFEFAHQFLSKPMGAINTVVLITSSLTMAWGVRLAQLGKNRGLIICLALTLFGGYAFMAIKSVEYKSKWEHNLGLGKANKYDLRPKGAAAGAPGGAIAPAATTQATTTTSPATSPATKAAAAVAVAAMPAAPAPGASQPKMGPINSEWLDPNEGTNDAVKVRPVAPPPAGLAKAVPAHGAAHGGGDAHAPGHDPLAPDPGFAEMSVIDRNRTSTFFQIYFMMTGLHGLHVVIGMALIFWILVRSFPKSSRRGVGMAGLASIGLFMLYVGILVHHNPSWIIGVIILLASVAGLFVLKPAIAIASPVVTAHGALAGAGDFGPHYFTPVDIVGLYWHLVDLIWIFLFPLLYLIH